MKSSGLLLYHYPENAALLSPGKAIRPSITGICSNRDLTDRLSLTASASQYKTYMEFSMKKSKLAIAATEVILSMLLLSGCHGHANNHNDEEHHNPSFGIANDGNVLTGAPFSIYGFYTSDITAKYGRIYRDAAAQSSGGAVQSGDAVPAPEEWHYVISADLFKDRTLTLPIEEEFTLTGLNGETVVEKVVIGAEDSNVGPVDPLFKYQWHIYNNGTENFGVEHAPVAGMDLNVIEAWNNLTAMGKTPGDGVHVAVLDTPADFAHEDLESRKFEDSDVPDTARIRNIKGLTPEDLAEDADDLHGTGVSGLIAADGTNGKGGAGIAFNATLTSYAFDNYEDDDDDGDDEDEADYSFVKSSPEKILEIKKEIDRRITETFKMSSKKNTDLFNMSLGFDYLTYNSPAVWQYLNNLRDSNIALFKAAGNEFEDIDDSIIEEERYDKYANLDREFKMTSSVERHPYTINVGAVNAQGIKSSYSSSSADLWVSGLGGEMGYSGGDDDAAALVTTISSYAASEYSDTDWDAGSPFRMLPNTAFYTAKMNGTSAATPTISGVGALIYSAKPDITVPQLRYILAATSRNDEALPSLAVDDSVTISEIEGVRVNTGWQTNKAGMRHSSFYGFGLADAGKAVEKAGSCDSDKNCKKRAALPEEFVTAVNSCSYADPDSKTKIVCTFRGLSDQDGTPAKAVEIDALTVDIAGYSFITAGQTNPSCKGLNKDPASQKFRAGVVNANNVTQINFTHSDTDVDAVLKPYYTGWDYYGSNVWSADAPAGDNPLEMPAAGFYMEEVSGDTSFTMTIRSQCQLDVAELNRTAKVTVYGYTD